MSAAAVERSTNFHNYIKGPQHIFKYLGVDMSMNPRSYFKYIQLAVVANILLITLHMMLYNFTTDDGNAKRSASISYTNYNVVALGKILAIYYNRQAMAKSVEDLKDIFPNKQTESKYHLEHYLKHYLWVEYLVWGFFRLILAFYLISPFVQSLVSLLKAGEFSYALPIFVWTFVPMGESIAQYIAFYVLVSTSSLWVGMAITSCDLCLYSMVSQLCLHFDLMSQKIMELQPEHEEEAFKKLNAIALHHREVINLANKINAIFAPSIIFSLISSSFIICFVAHQMLDDVSFITLAKAFVLLLYESKQVVITCYFGNKLKECSALISESLFMHNWMDGSVRYRKQIHFMLLNTQKPFVLSVPGIANITLVTLKEVYGNAYRLFTVLKSR